MRPADSIGWSETISAQRHRRAESRISSLLGRIPRPLAFRRRAFAYRSLRVRPRSQVPDVEDGCWNSSRRRA